MANSSKTKNRTGRNPFRGFLDVMSEMNRVQENWMMHGQASRHSHDRGHVGAYVPHADIFATGKDLVVRCELPGVRKDDVSVTVSHGILTISGHRDAELDDSKVVYYTRERVYGAFRRSMVLPEGIEQRHISATVRNGLLEVTIAGGAAVTPQKIAIIDEDEEKAGA